MKLSELAIKRPVTTTMIVLLVVLLGFIALQRTNIDLFPDLTYPGAAVITSYEGVGPEEIETMVTRPIENSLATVTNIQTLTSTSSKGQSVVVAEFSWGTDMDAVSMDMRESLDLIEGLLPEEAETPFVVKFDPSLMPIMQIGVTGSGDLADLKKVIEDRISPRLERLEGVASVNMVGGLEREILVTVNQSKLSNYDLDLSQVINALRMENIDLSAGSVNRGDMDFLVRLRGKFTSLQEIKNIKLATGQGNIKLDDIAEIEDTFKEITSKARLNGDDSIGLTLQKQTDANTVKVSNLVKEEIANISEDFNGNIELVPIIDQADFIERSIGSVGTNALYGALLAIIVLFFFLRNLRSTVIIGVAIPVSIIATILLIYFGDLTLNLMTLGGLALGIGMLVDNSIVVLENIYRFRMQGAGRLEAARRGSQEVGMAITASTLTTAVVFLPVVFVGGMASQLFRELALTVTFSLLASLLVSLTLIPVMSSRILKIDTDSERSDKGQLQKVKSIYRNSLAWALDHRWLVILFLLLALGGSIALYPGIGAEFIPSMDQGQIELDARLPAGTSLSRTERMAARLEEEITSLPEVDYVLTNVGTSGNVMQAGGNATGSGVSSLFIKLTSPGERDRTTAEIIEEIRNKFNLPDVEMSVTSMDMIGGNLGGGKPVYIQIEGDNLDTLAAISAEIKDKITGIEGIREIEDSFAEGRPELQIAINRSLAADYGLRTGQIGSIIENSLRGNVATRYEEEGEEYDVRVKLDEEDIRTPSQLENLMLSSPTGVRVPLSSVASFQITEGPQTIERENQVRYATVTADLYQADLGRVMEKIQGKLDQELTLPPGYTIKYGGQYSEMVESFAELYFAFILAVILVYMVMASQFESLLHPFIILFTVPMAVIGVLLGLYVTGHNFSVVSVIGIVMLAGIVVNNAIVLVDYINTLRKEGKNIREAVLAAAPIRLRPILMTALTTILALLPLALGLGEGAEIQAPMAVVVIGGLTVATLLTLYVVPVLYSLLAGLGRDI